MAMAIMPMRPLTMLVENSGDETKLPSTWTEAPKSNYIDIMPRARHSALPLANPWVTPLLIRSCLIHQARLPNKLSNYAF